MILTVTLNAAIDKTYRVERFSLDRVHRPDEWRIAAGGKGINVARVFQALGGNATATGFLGGFNGRFIADSLKSEGIQADFVRTRNESRVCIAIVDPIALTQTEVNESGPEISSSEVRKLKRTFERLIKDRDWSFVTLSGSIPPGVPSSIYADLIDIARSTGTRAVLDASGEALRLGVGAVPWMLKPNIHELSYLIGQELREFTEAENAAREILKSGVDVIVVTGGKDGCICVVRDQVWRAKPPQVPFVSAVGSGDSFLGGFLRTVELDRPMEEALRIGTAAGAANAASYGAGFVTSKQIIDLTERVVITCSDVKKVGKETHAGVL